MSRQILQYIFKVLTKLVLQRHEPKIIAITGNVGKTSTKETIYLVLKQHFNVRRSLGNYNNELGVPLTVLGLEVGPHSIFGWLRNILKGVKVAVFEKEYPEILILEMGIDKPGDMKYLMDFIPVTIGVITAIGDFPVHLEFFSDREEFIKEKACLVQSLTRSGLAVLNYDDPAVRAIGKDLSSRVVYYGFNEGADLRISNFQSSVHDLSKGDFGVSFKLDYEGSVVPVRLNKVFGKQQAFVAAAAANVALFLGLNMVDVSTALRKYRSVAGRTRLIEGVKKTWIIDGTYNASPLATIASLDILKEIALQVQEPGFKKIVVLGDMLELGVNTEAGHRQVGKEAASVADLLFTVGDRACFIADEARRQGLSKENIFEFHQISKAGILLQEKIKEGNLILIKGSRAMHMERIVKEIMAHPEKAERLLVK